MAKKKQALKEQFEPLERQPVFLSMIILREMGIDTEKTPIHLLWGRLWNAIAAYRDTKKPEQWTTRILRGILSGQATFDSGDEWVELNQVLNEIWEVANESSNSEAS